MKYHGKQICEGIAIGKIYRHRKNGHQVQKHAVIDIAGEMERLALAVDVAKSQIKQLYEMTVRETGEEKALIFEIHRMILADDDYLDAIKAVIAEGVNAEYAVSMAQEQFVRLFRTMDDKYMKERATDIEDISQRLINILGGSREEEIHPNEAVILLAEDVTPSEVIGMDKNHILAIITEKGSAASHAAILAKSRNIPMIVNVQIPKPQELDGKVAVADCFEGVLITEPEDVLIGEMSKRKEQWHKEQQELLSLKGKENRTRDGRRIEIFANIGNVKEASDACDADAGGIGLFRSEYLYMERNTPPTEEEQFESYKAVLEKMAGKKVIIRTIDIGADKQADYLKPEKEANPALGCRAVRFCLEKPEILITQLRAIYRASAYGNAAIMFPMIISVEEVIKLKQMAKQVRERLAKEGYCVKKVPIGIMIETPAAALISDVLAGEADFFSIGTNDLIQYTLAIDRQNDRLEGYYSGMHPAVLQLMELTVKNAHKAGIPVGICGEAAADVTLTETFLGLEADELSVSPSAVLKVKRAVRNI